MSKSSIWKKQTLHPDCDSITCPVYHPIKDYAPDSTGHYVLIRIDREERTIELAVCDKTHRIAVIFKGKKCQDVYHAAFTREKKLSVEWFRDKGHIAYLGKELKKAELALNQGTEYLQE